MKYKAKDCLKATSKIVCDFAKKKCEEGIEKFNNIKEKYEMYNDCKGFLEAEIKYNISLTSVCHSRSIDINKIFEDKMIDTSVLKSKLFKDIEATAIGSGCSYLLYILVKKFGKASTGTAISKLHGIVAKNAALSKIGFGTIASGGLGINGGLAILGIITLTPPILQILFLDENGNFSLDNSCTIEEAIQKEAEKIYCTALEIKNIDEEIEKILGIN